MSNLNRRLKLGMVGGGQGAFIGAVHRKAAVMDGMAELVAGCFSSTPEKSKASAAELMIDPGRAYGSYEEMIAEEAKLPVGERIDYVSIVTPNHVHHRVAKAFAQAGFNVVCDKPMTTTLADAEDLCHVVKDTGIVFALTHNYTGYPMVKQARAMVKAGDIGEIRKVVVEYPQGWLATALEQEGAKQAVWRTDPGQSGPSGCIGDIGSHCENLVSYVTGLEMESLCADLTIFVPGRRLDDDGNILIRYTNGARGILYASQVSVGEENNLRIRVYGTKASLEWHQENPNYLSVRFPDGPEKVYKRGNGYLCEAAQRNSRLPFGHPEAFIEAFANIYVNAMNAMRAKAEGRQPDEFDLDFPTVQDGARGVHFIGKAVESSASAVKWVDARYSPPGA